MPEENRRAAKEGIGIGIVAGVIFALFEILASAIMNQPPLMPLRMFASVLVGRGAIETMSLGSAVLVGGVVHLILSAFFGLIYGLINAHLSPDTQTRWGRQVGMGMLYGAVLWFVNFQIIARLIYPWFLDAPQFAQLMLHVVCYGLPLALMYAGTERKVRRIMVVPRTA